MKKMRFLSAFIFFFGLASYAQTPAGVWESEYCQSYDDGLAYGTYGYRFNNDGTLSTYVQKYSDSSCKNKTNVDEAAHGTYSFQPRSNGNSFDLSIQFSHVSQSVSYEVQFEGDHIKLCRMGKCQAYLKR